MNFFHDRPEDVIQSKRAFSRPYQSTNVLLYRPATFFIGLLLVCNNVIL